MHKPKADDRRMLKRRVPDYDAAFFRYVNAGALLSARRLLPQLLEESSIASVLDVGCGQGAWLSVWSELGVSVTGIDGDYVDRASLLIPPENFLAHDLSRGFDLQRRFDLVQSLEVAEHLPAEAAAQFVQSLVRHGDLVLFSAAPKGQGGDHHVNEQDYDYWRALFAQHGYVPFDYVRPLLRDERDVEPWYRFNTILYVSLERLDSLPERIRRTRIPDDEPIRDVSPVLYRLRKKVTALLPVPAVTAIAKLKERTSGTLRSVAAGTRARP